jgi:hypothetical protein
VTGNSARPESAKALLWKAHKKLKSEADSGSGSAAYLTRVRWLREQVADLAMQAENLHDLQARHLLPEDEPKVKSFWEVLTDAIDEYKDGRSRRGITRSLKVRLGAAEARISELEKLLSQSGDYANGDGKNEPGA